MFAPTNHEPARTYAFYTYGYVDGDKSGNTSSVEGGTCTKID
jgi:hypothetical protein